MNVLKDYQLPSVSGGDYWCAESSDGSVSEQEAAHYSSNSLALAGPSATSAACLGGTAAVAGAIGSAVRSPSWDNIAKAVGGVIGYSYSPCSGQVGTNYNNAGYARTMFAY